MAIWPTKDNARGPATVHEGLAWQLSADQARLAVMHCFSRTVAGLWAWSGVGAVAVGIPPVHCGRAMKSYVHPWTEEMRRNMGVDGDEEPNREGRDAGVMAACGRNMGVLASGS